MINKVSEITVENIANYIRVSDYDDDELGTYLKIAKSYISNYTGIPETSEVEGAETLDTYADFIIVVYILCQDMYDNRVMYVDGKSINKVVQTILDMHTRNNL